MNENFVIVAGQEAHDRWEANKNPQEELVESQQRQHAEGLRVVEICPSLYGWSVRYASGLDNFDLIASCSRGELDGTRTHAVNYAQNWVNNDPKNRYAFIRKANQDLDERWPYGQK